MLDEIKMLPFLLFCSWLIPLASEQSEKEAKTTASSWYYIQTDRHWRSHEQQEEANISDTCKKIWKCCLHQQFLFRLPSDHTDKKSGRATTTTTTFNFAVPLGESCLIFLEYFVETRFSFFTLFFFNPRKIQNGIGLELQPLQPHPFRIESPQTLQQHVQMAWSIIVNVIIIINRADKPIRLLFFFFDSLHLIL
jgi:hypothetical protein